jgi:hypothetical protein
MAEKSLPGNDEKYAIVKSVSLVTCAHPERLDSFRLMQSLAAMWDIIAQINQVGTWGSRQTLPQPARNSGSSVTAKLNGFAGFTMARLRI